MIADLEPLVLRLCSALGNGVAQGLLLASCALIGLRLFRDTSAATRYAVAFATLLTVAVLPAVHFILASSVPAPNDLAPASPSLESATERLVVADDSEPKAALNGPVGSGYHWTESAAAQASASPSHASIEEPTQPADETALMNFPPPRLADDLALETRATTAESGVPFEFSGWSPGLPSAAVPIRFPLPTTVAAGIVATWLVLACLRLASLTWQCVALQRLKRQRQSVPDSVLAQFTEIGTQMGLRRTVDIGTAPDLRSPIAIGFLRPAILLPEALIESAATDLDPMLRHELAHIQRRDDWTNLVQQLVKAVYFFHPGILALSRRLNLDREIACDDHVLSASRAPRNYALFLTDFASRSHGRQWAAAPAAWNNPSQLQERIRMILDSKRNTSPRIAPIRTGILSLAALLIAATGIGAAPRLALDASQPATETISIGSSSEGAELVVVEDIADPETLLADTDHVRVEVFTTDSEDDLDRPKEKPERGTSSDSKNENRNSKFIVRSTGGATTVMPLERHHTVIHATPAPHPVPAPHPEMAELPQPPNPPRIERSIRTSVLTTADSDEARSLEERMRRLEKLVESLVQKRTNPELVDPQFQFNFEGLAKSMEQASKDVERSMRDAERKVREAQQRTADITRERLRASAAEGAEKGKESRRRALEQQRDSLQRQIDKLQSNVDMLESHLDRLEDELDNAEEASDERAEGAGNSEKAKAKDKYKEKEKEKTKGKHPDGKPDQAPDSPKVKDPNTPPAPPTPGALIRN